MVLKVEGFLAHTEIFCMGFISSTYCNITIFTDYQSAATENYGYKERVGRCKSFCSNLIIHLLQRLKVVSDQKACNDLNHSPSPPSVETSSATTPDVNFQYLKHVVIKFVCSREDEALQLIRAISTLLEFSPQEEEHVRQYLNYKVCY